MLSDDHEVSQPSTPQCHKSVYIRCLLNIVHFYLHCVSENDPHCIIHYIVVISQLLRYLTYSILIHSTAKYMHNFPPNLSYVPTSSFFFQSVLHWSAAVFTTCGLSPGSREAKVQRAKVCLNCTEPSVARSSCWSLTLTTKAMVSSRCAWMCMKKTVLVVMKRAGCVDRYENADMRLRFGHMLRHCARYKSTHYYYTVTVHSDDLLSIHLRSSIISD